jgi:hypothetical protein
MKTISNCSLKLFSGSEKPYPVASDSIFILILRIVWTVVRLHITQMPLGLTGLSALCSQALCTVTSGMEESLSSHQYTVHWPNHGLCDRFCSETVTFSD